MKKGLLRFLVLLVIILWSNSCEKSDLSPSITSDLTLLPIITTTPSFVSTGERTDYKEVPSLSGYLVNDLLDKTKGVYYIYNPSTHAYVSLLYKYWKMPDGSERNQVYTMSGLLVASADINLAKDSVYNKVVGVVPYFNLGIYSIPKEDSINNLECSRTSGFNACYICSRDDCHSKWYCDAPCAMSHGACVAGWLTACLILNPPKIPWDGRPVYSIKTTYLRLEYDSLKFIPQ